MKKRKEDSSLVWARGNRAKRYSKWLPTAAIILLALVLYATAAFLDSNFATAKFGLTEVEKSLIRKLMVLPTLVVVLALGAWLNVRSRRAAKLESGSRNCSKCGYERTNESTCPECGHVHRRYL